MFFSLSLSLLQNLNARRTAAARVCVCGGSGALQLEPILVNLLVLIDGVEIVSASAAQRTTGRCRGCVRRGPLLVLRREPSDVAVALDFPDDDSDDSSDHDSNGNGHADDDTGVSAVASTSVEVGGGPAIGRRAAGGSRGWLQVACPGHADVLPGGRAERGGIHHERALLVDDVVRETAAGGPGRCQ